MDSGATRRQQRLGTRARRCGDHREKAKSCPGKAGFLAEYATGGTTRYFRTGFCLAVCHVRLVWEEGEKRLMAVFYVGGRNFWKVDMEGEKPGLSRAVTRTGFLCYMM